MERSLITANLQKQKLGHHVSMPSMPRLKAKDPTLGIESLERNNRSLLSSNIDKNNRSLEQIQNKKDTKSRYGRNKSVAQISMLPYIGPPK